MNSNKRAEWIVRLDRVTEEVKDSCSSARPEILATRPGPNAWSATEVIAHVMVLNTSYFPLFDALIAGTYLVPWMGRIGVMPRFFGRMILKSVTPGNPRKSKTLRMWQPVRDNQEHGIALKFSEHQEKLKSYLQALEPFLEQDVVIHSPANKNIVYPLNTAIEILVTHEERHLNQFKRALRDGVK